MRRLFLILLAFTVLAAPLALRADGAVDDDDTLNLAPVKKGADKVDPTPVATAVSAVTVVPTAVPTLAATAVPMPRPKPRPRALARAPFLRALEVMQVPDGVRILIKGGGPISGAAANLSAPDRVLIKISGACLAPGRLPKERAIGFGAAKRVRLATKNAHETWVVVDLSQKVAFKTGQPTADSFELTLMTGGSQPKPAAAPASAEVPKVNLMLFDENVVYEDKQYDRFPCANFIYNAADTFPLKRDFVSTLVFHDGYGAFVGNVRILDPEGQLAAQTEQPFAFNLFNRLTDFMVELPWKVVFKEKGTYTLYLALNGTDVVKQTFYVGHNTDTPPPE